VVSAAGALVALFIYNVTHAIPDPIARGDDLGNGLVALFGLVMGFFFSVPASFWVYRILTRKFFALLVASKSTSGRE
jgi:hypothetical protein